MLFTWQSCWAQLFNAGPRTKALQWRKVPAYKLAEAAFWAQSSPLDLGIDVAAITSLFVLKDVSAKKSTSEKADVLLVIDRKRANNIEIMLNSRLKLPLPKLANAVLCMDNSSIDLEGKFAHIVLVIHCTDRSIPNAPLGSSR